MEPYVLVVDDSPDGREMVAEYLAFRGIAVQTAADGTEALRLALAHPPVIVLLDLTMPGMDGWELARRVKANSHLKDVLLIALTAHAFDHERQQATAAGVDAIVGKPFDMVALGDAVLLAMGKDRAALVPFDTLTRARFGWL